MAAGFNFSDYPQDQPAAPNYQQDYWAPDRAAVLAAQGQTDTSGKVWNGTTWVPAPAAGGTPTPGQPTGGGGQGDPAGFQQAWFQYAQQHGGTVDSLKAFVATNPQYGATISGSKGSKVTFPGGQAYQAVRSAGINGGIGPAWDDLSGAGAGGGTAGGYGTVPGLGFGSFTSPFTAPTAEEAMNSPGLQFALEEANRMGQNSAAAKGTLLNGRFQQALNASNIQNALQGYGDVYNRAFQTFTRNQDAPFNKYLAIGQLGQQAAAAS